ncbi:penicillin-binding protein activator LpoB [Atopomonas sediminilitoris]|uniref:penicillin-binding protein activator LpoB n=1 Tax=Atopomonas sediminilitoris TaxID=2919919 RepID=UPI001F4ECA7D|nr:penicillin-binding protein activator LpoB [Atopomonas sediminilitoris]MCJ8168928.1 penicillin-binding protein activator LpoB [Atopomonas sediminilitoris]
MGMMRFITLASLLFVSACSIHSQHDAPTLSREGRWALLPVVNYAQAPLAGERAEQILLSILASEGLTPTRYPLTTSADELPQLDDRARLQTAQQWASKQSFTYAITGSVDEWQYKNGLDGEPAVGITLQVIEPATGRVLWSTSAARAGWSRESLAGAAQKVITDLVDELPLD